MTMLQPMIDLEATGVDAGRLARSLTLQAERTGIGRYRIAGGTQDHWVDLYTENHPRCDCGDHVWRDALCKHILATLMREENERILRAKETLFTRLQIAA